jgi:hypothetical protein
MPILLDASGLNFRVGLGLGRAARAFYSVKQLKTTFRAGLGQKKNFAGFKISAHGRPVRFVGGPAGRAQNAQVYLEREDVRVANSRSRRMGVLTVSLLRGGDEPGGGGSVRCRTDTRNSKPLALSSAEEGGRRDILSH